MLRCSRVVSELRLPSFGCFQCLILLLAVYTLHAVTGSEVSSIISETSREVELEQLVRRLDAKLDASFQQHNKSRTSCSCYEVENPYMRGQTICICKNFCSAGSEFVALGDLSCDTTSEAVEGGPLKYIPCEDEKKFRQAVARMGSEGLEIPISYRQPQWLHSRESVEWRNGMTYYEPLTEDTPNLAHLIRKVMQLLLVNNCTVAALLPTVDRIMMPRHPGILHILQRQGTDGFHAMLLSTLLATALRPILSANIAESSQMKRDMLSGNQSMAYGRVEFEAPSNAASEERPLCFQKVLVPGFIRGLSFIGGPLARNAFSKHLFKRLDLNPKIARGKVRLVWYRRLNRDGRRHFTPDTANAIKAMLDGLDLEIREINTEGMPFREQVLHALEGDIFLSLHGSGLVVPATFAREESVVLEVMPYRAEHTIFRVKALGSGITYMLYDCQKGPPQPEDDVFSGTSIKECMLANGACKRYFLQHRKVDLPEEDVAGIEQLLKEAKEIVLDARKSKALAGRNLQKRYRKLCISNKVEINCLQSSIQSPLADPNFQCILKSDCNVV